MAEYLAELKKLAINCEFGNFLEDALCDRLVCGLKDEATQQRLLIEVDLPIKKAFEIIHGIKAAAKNAREIQSNGQHKSVEMNAVISRKQSKQASKSTVPTTHCSRCLGSGHEAAVCRFRNAKCHKCNKNGHIAKAYRSEGQQLMQSGQIKHKRGSSGMHQITPDEVADIVHIHTISDDLPELQSKHEGKWCSTRNGKRHWDSSEHCE